MFIWIRATFPRYRYDQIMRLGWKVFIPVTMVWIIVVGTVMQTPLGLSDSLNGAAECYERIKDFFNTYFLPSSRRALR